MHPNVGGRSYACHVTTLRDPLVEPLGKKASDTLEKVFGLRTVGDLLRHYPRRYYTRGELTPLDSLSEGDHVTVLARVAMSTVLGGRVPARPRDQAPRPGPASSGSRSSSPTARASCSSRSSRGVGFHAKQLQQGALALFAGTVSSFRGRRQLVHPEYELLPASAADERLTTELAEEFATELIPVYPASAKLTSWTISRHVGAVLDALDAGRGPAARRGARSGTTCGRASWRSGRSTGRTDRDDLRHARKRLKWDEAFTMQVALAQRRHAAAAMPAVPRPAGRRTGSPPRSTGGCRSRSPRASGRSARSSRTTWRAPTR